jgi:hypothetical protein
LVLIDADADGYIVSHSGEKWYRQQSNEWQFKDEYYSDVEGGRKAALDLRDSVQKYLKQLRPTGELSRLPIIIKAFANSEGLSQLLMRTKIIEPPFSLGDFAKGFSQAFDTSDFILVGSGKDRADGKIKG